MDTFRDKLNEIKRVIEEDVQRKRVLLLCQQSEPKSFEEYSSSGSFRRLEKFESSTYSEVLKAIDLADNNKPVVMKIMRALSRGVLKRMPSITTKGCQAYNDIFNELVVTQALSQLHDGVILNGQPNALYRTHFFCLIHEIKVLSGNLDRQLEAARRKRSTMKVILPVSDIRAPVERLAETTTVAAANNSSLISSNPLSDATSTNQSNRLGSSLMSSSGPDLSSISQNPSTSSISRNARVSTVSPSESTRDALDSGKTSQHASDIDPIRRASDHKSPGGRASNNQSDAEESGRFSVPNEVNQKLNKDENLSKLTEDERMLMESLPHEYVVSVMRHDGKPLWWMMSHKKLKAEQLTSVLVQVIVGLAIAENVYLYEHRDLHVSNILIKRTTNEHIPFILDGQRYIIISQGVKATIIDATFSRLTHNGRVYYRDLTSTLEAYGTEETPPKMSLQNRSYRQMVLLTKNKWDEFTPKTNLIWLTYLCETLMKDEIMRSDQFLLNEIRKIRNYTLKVKTTFDLLTCFPFEKTRVSQ